MTPMVRDREAGIGRWMGRVDNPEGQKMRRGSLVSDSMVGPGTVKLKSLPAPPYPPPPAPFHLVLF